MHNYITNRTYFLDTAGPIMLASAAYRLSAMDLTSVYVPYAERTYVRGGCPSPPCALVADLPLVCLAPLNRTSLPSVPFSLLNQRSQLMPSSVSLSLRTTSTRTPDLTGGSSPLSIRTTGTAPAPRVPRPRLSSTSWRPLGASGSTKAVGTKAGSPRPEMTGRAAQGWGLTSAWVR
jgi:hypothetical protein